MRKIIIAVMIVLMTFSAALAEWSDTFKETYNKKSIDEAVVDAMKEGVSPKLIVENGLQLKTLNPQNLVKALFCAGAKGQDIREAASEWQISELIVAAGYKKSIAECGDQVADVQPYPGFPGPSFAKPTIDPGDPPTVSPDTPLN